MTVSGQSETLCANALIWDAHAGVFPDPEIDLELLDHWLGRHVNYVSINVGFDVLDWQQTLTVLARYRSWILSHGDKFMLAGSVADILAAKALGKLAVSFDIEGMNALRGDIHMLGVYHALGVRQMLFAYNLNNAAAGGCHDSDSGLTAFGREIVNKMNQLGLIVDCSHGGYRTTMDIMELADKPVVFSHSNPVAVFDHQRNIRDEQIKACARTGGVVGLNGMGIFLGGNDISIETLIRHIRYNCDLVGAEHVGLGFDYSPPLGIEVGEILASRPDYWPRGQDYDTPHIKHAGPSLIPALVDGLLAHDFGDQEIKGILGENFKRVALANWGA